MTYNIMIEGEKPDCINDGIHTLRMIGTYTCQREGYQDFYAQLRCTACDWVANLKDMGGGRYEQAHVSS